jgi:hypothetical protein
MWDGMNDGWGMGGGMGGGMLFWVLLLLAVGGLIGWLIAKKR